MGYEQWFHMKPLRGWLIVPNTTYIANSIYNLILSGHLSLRS